MLKNVLLSIDTNNTLFDCELMAAARLNDGTLIEYLVKKTTDDEREMLNKNNIVADGDWCVIRLIDGDLNDDSWYTSWDTARDVLDAIWNEIRSVVFDDVECPPDSVTEIGDYLNNGEYFIKDFGIFDNN